MAAALSAWMDCFTCKDDFPMLRRKMRPVDMAYYAAGCPRRVPYQMLMNMRAHGWVPTGRDYTGALFRRQLTPENQAKAM